MEALGVEEIDGVCVVVEMDDIVVLWDAELLGV